MAAWSDHEEVVEEPVMGRKPLEEAPAKVSTPNEPYPSELWKFFTDSDIEQLIVDASKELCKRQGGAWFRLGPLSDGQYGGPRMYQR